MKSRGLGWRGVPLVAERDDLRRSFIRGRRDRERAVLHVKERVRRGAAAILLRAARELFDDPIRRIFAERRVQSCLQVRCIRASRRFDDHSGDDEIAVRIGSDGGISAGHQRDGARILRIRRNTDAEIAERKDRADRQAATTERSRAARTVEADRVARRESDDLRTVREWDRAGERPIGDAVGRGRDVIRGKDDAPGTIAVDCAQHEATIGRAV